MDLTEHLDRLRATIERIDELQRGRADRGLPRDADVEARTIHDHLAQLQRQSGWAMRAALEQARAAGEPWEDLTTQAQVHVGGRARDGLLEAVERQLAVVEQRLREAITDAEALRRIHDTSSEPEVAGQAAAHQTLTHNRWSEALGARAQLEALYQELAGRPSPGHAASSRILQESGLRPNPVGLSGPDTATAAFLQEHADRGLDGPQVPAERVRSDHGLEL